MSAAADGGDFFPNSGFQGDYGQSGYLFHFDPRRLLFLDHRLEGLVNSGRQVGQMGA